jgi:hypothetical protein
MSQSLGQIVNSSGEESLVQENLFLRENSLL